MLRTKKTISFDIAEVSPRFDQDDATANLASVMVFSIVYTLAKYINIKIEEKILDFFMIKCHESLIQFVIIV